MNTLEAIEYLAEPSNYSSDGKLITPNWNHIEPFEFAQKVLSKMDVFMKDVITQEIEWCEENHGMKSKEFEDGFIAGLKQVIFLVEAAQSGLTSRALDVCPECDGNGVTGSIGLPHKCPHCDGTGKRQ